MQGRTSTSCLTVLLLVFCLQSAIGENVGSCEESFIESASIRPLGDTLGRFVLHMEMVSRRRQPWSLVQQWDARESYMNHYYTFPKTVGQIASEFRLEHLDLSLTQGVWDADAWGPAYFPAPSGAEFIASLGTSDKKEADHLWVGLKNALSGMFCSSTSSIKDSDAVDVTDSRFQDSLQLGNEVLKSNRTVRYASLPRENVCTENLTPWLKHLPCGDRAGLASLLAPLKIANSHFHSLGMHLRSKCIGTNCEESEIEWRQTVMTVYDSGSIPRQISFESAFKTPKTAHMQACPHAIESNFFVEYDKRWKSSLKFYPVPPPSSVSAHPSVLPNAPTEMVSYNLLPGSSNPLPASFMLTWQDTAQRKWSQSPIRARRYISGKPLGDRAKFVLVIENRGKGADAAVDIHEIIPWYFRMFYHTMRVTFSDGREMGPSEAFEDFQLTSSVVRQTPWVMRARVRVPAQSSATVTVEFEKMFQTIDDFPPDSHRGFDIPATIVHQATPSSVSTSTPPIFQNAYGQREYTQCLLVPFPTPDFSMPYNVITISCTVLALMFGSIYNGIVRRNNVLPAKGEKQVSKLQKLIGKYRSGEETN